MKYRVTICTGDVGGSGTDATVFLSIYGDLGDTGERLMITSKNNVNKFEKGNVSDLLFKMNPDGEMHFKHKTSFCLLHSMTSSSLNRSSWARCAESEWAMMVVVGAVVGSWTRC